MTTSDECLSLLESLVQSGDQNALTLADTTIEDFLQSSTMRASDAARTLGEIQAEFARRIEPSPVRADILDLIGTHVLRLLEATEGRED